MEFRCRKCYKLRYPSQEKDLDFLLKPLAAAAGVSKRTARKALEESAPRSMESQCPGSDPW
jgi:hypothetical protein